MAARNSASGRRLDDLWTAMGLTPSEVGAYELLAEAGPETASALAKSTGQSRGRIYLVLRGLVERGFVREDPGPPIRFTAVPPREVLRMAAQAAARRAQELLAVASEMPEPVLAEPNGRPAPMAATTILRGRKAVLAEAIRILDRSSSRFYLAGAGRLGERVAASESLIRALRAKSAQGVNVGVAIGTLGREAEEVKARIRPALVAPLANPDAFRLTIIVGDKEAVLVLPEPDDGSPSKGDDYGVQLHGEAYADAFGIWFERLGLGGPSGTTSMNPVIEAQDVLHQALRGARREVAVMGAAGWLNTIFGAGAAGSEAAPERPDVKLRLIAEADASSWRIVKRLRETWDVRMVRTAPEWVAVIDGTETFAGLPSEEREQVGSVRRQNDPAEAQHHMALFAAAWRDAAPIRRTSTG